MRSSRRNRPGYGLMIVILLWIVATLALIIVVAVKSHGASISHGRAVRERRTLH